jgi:hypothetical protein
VYLREVLKTDSIANDDAQPSKSNLSNALLLYIFIIETLLDQEIGKNGQVYFSKLLQEKKFIVSAAVVAIDIFGFITEDSSISFAETLAKFNVDAVDVWKVLTSFYMSKAISERAPRGLSIHLREIETSIIFELSWVKGSPLYSYLQVLHLHDKSSVTSSNDQSEEELEFEEPSEASSNSEGFMKTKSIEQDELKTPERTQFIPNEENQSQVLVPMPKLARPPTLDRSLNVFFKRFLFLLGERAYLLSDSLQIDDFHKEQLWVVLKQIICEETSLIENNTIDHILVCTLFAKCKMMTSSRTFQEILDSYCFLV